MGDWNIKPVERSQISNSSRSRAPQIPNIIQMETRLNAHIGFEIKYENPSSDLSLPLSGPAASNATKKTRHQTNAKSSS